VINRIKKLANRAYVYIKKNIRRLPVVFSFGLTTYKAFDYRKRYLGELDINEKLNKSLNERRDENDELTAIYQDVILRITMDNFSINDIKLPMWYQVLDGTKFRVIKFNNEYVSIYGNNAFESFAKTNKEIAGEIGQEWESNNQIVLEKKGKVHFFYERYITKEGVVGIGKFAKWIIVKNNNIYLYGIQIEF